MQSKERRQRGLADRHHEGASIARQGWQLRTISMKQFYCDCGEPVFGQSTRCRDCEIAHANRLGDWSNPIFDGEPPIVKQPLANLNQEADE